MWTFIRDALHLVRKKPAEVEPLRHRWRNRVRPGLEVLENRLVPALHFIVDTLQDTPDANPGNGVAADANGWTSLRAAIMEVNEHLASEGTIDFKQGLTGTITLGSALPDLTKDFTIAGPGAANLTIRRDANQGQFRIFTVNVNMSCSIAGLTLRDGNTDTNGGAIANKGSLTLTACVLSNNHAGDHGGAVYNFGTLVASSCVVSNNTANDNGGGFYNTLDSSLYLYGCEINNNSADRGGGIYNNSGTCRVLNSSKITNNQASGINSEGGGIYNRNAVEFTMTGGLLEDNNAGKGGGIYNESSTATITGVSIQWNTAAKGGGFYVAGGTIALDTCWIENNIATVLGDGGAWKNPGTYTDTNCIINDFIEEDP